MGNCAPSTSDAKAIDTNTTKGVMSMQSDLADTVRIPLVIQVAHFTPSSFPVLPIINVKNNKLCESSWGMIVANNVVDEYGGSISGITVFYNEFYERLDAVDSNGRFDAILSKNSTGANKIAAKGAIIIRIVNFMLKIDSNNKQTQMLTYMLGKSHSQKGIRPWQYSVFVQTLLLTISSRLGTAASNNVMEAWVNLFAFVMQSMLPPAIKDQVVETELNINTSSEFAGGRVAEEVAELEEVNEMRRKMKAHSQGSRSIKEGSAMGGNSINGDVIKPAKANKASPLIGNPHGGGGAGASDSLRRAQGQQQPRAITVVNRPGSSIVSGTATATGGGAGGGSSITPRTQAGSDDPSSTHSSMTHDLYRSAI